MEPDDDDALGVAFRWLLVAVGLVGGTWGITWIAYRIVKALWP